LDIEADNQTIGQVTHTQPSFPKEPSLSKGQESATHQASVAECTINILSVLQLVLESELPAQEHSTRPDSQLSNTSIRWRHLTDVG
jgi:hypothetical protein